MGQDNKGSVGIGDFGVEFSKAKMDEVIIPTHILEKDDD